MQPSYIYLVALLYTWYTSRITHVT
ncbi:hypothetical protein F383_38553 [Gossypium arboreum]|uniref:Uncharacterized protein n=1 Tax=Gossypium arboreum TaxID=29729 RepID=A0A0B0MGZ8_GOSAR|nr:hypothetical protein F383_38553 [Gossypium arboreum]